MAAPAHKTEAELRAALEALPENVKGEIIDGELFVQPRPRFRHARASLFVGRHIGGPFDLDDGGPGGWWILVEPGIELPNAPEVAPDVAGWRRTRMPSPPPPDEPIRMAPDWVCEVLSPSNQRWDLLKKFPFYARTGVPWLWVIDPRARTLEVRELRDGKWTVRSVHGDEDSVRLPPFEEVELPLSRMWIPEAE
ncbi:MAG: Uma2 family endonuclease [Polyangiales bacterium]